jgi:DNA-binding NarL/FixJ family response regulator
VRVLIAGEHRLLREGLRAVLESGGIQVVGEARTGQEAISEAARLHPDVVVIDTTLPGLNGIDATRRIVTDRARNKVLALSMNADRRCVIAMLEAGAAGYLLMAASSAELLAALAAVNRGETYLSPAAANSVVQQAIGRGATSPRSEAARPVSAREREVLQLVAEGNSSKEIATTLRLAVSTVETHRRAIMGKLDLRSIAALTKYAIREGLTSAAA